jgi:transposase-like protein
VNGGEFAQEVIDEAAASVRDKVALLKRGWPEIGELVGRVCEQHGVDRQSLENGCRRKACTEVRKELVRKLVFELGASYAETARRLGGSSSAVSKVVSGLAVR